MPQSGWRIVEIVFVVMGIWLLVGAVLAGLWTLFVARRRGSDISTGTAPAESFAASGAGASPAPVAQPPERRAQAWDDVPGWVARDREWAVAVVLLGAPTVAEQTHRFVDFGARSIDWPGLLMAASEWPDEERLLIFTAYDLASDSRDAKGERLGGDHVTLQQMVGLDRDVADRLQAAVDVRRGRVDYLTAVVRAGGLG